MGVVTLFYRRDFLFSIYTKYFILSDEDFKNILSVIEYIEIEKTIRA